MTPEEHLRAALIGLGFADDPEMARTPELVAEFLRELVPGPLPEPSSLPTTSEDLLVVRDLAYQSLCAHHLLPFFGRCTIVLRPAGKVPGLGWYPKLLDALARRPQLQERLAAQLADALLDGLGAASVGVRLSARQLCVEMRGARASAEFEVVALRGGDDPAVRAALGAER